MELTGHQMIGASYSREGKSDFNAVNPETGEVLPPNYYDAVSKEIDQAIIKANKAFGIYRKKSAPEKSAFLDTIADEIMALGDELIMRCKAETGLPEGRLIGERGRTVNQLKLFADVVREGSWVDARIDTPIPDRKPIPKVDIRQMQIPLGVVGIFGASNFPLAFSVAGGDTASALAVGCPVVIKANPAHPGTSELVGQAIINAAKITGMPEGVFSLLHGKSIEVGQNLVKHPLVKAIGFTGSFAGGKALFDAAVQRKEPIPVYAEMGSINPIFILPGCLAQRGDEIAAGLVKSVTLGVGQFCTNPGVVVLQKSDEAETFIQQITQLFSFVDSGIMLTAAIKNNFLEGVAKLADMTDVEILAKGKSGRGGCRSTAFLLSTTVKSFLKNNQLGEEVFGPSTILVVAENIDEMEQVAANLRGHLTATLQCNPQELQGYTRFIEILQDKVGRLIINGFPTGVEVCHSMHHGGPFPATTDLRTTSVGTAAIKRFVRPICYQNFPQEALPDELKNENPLNIWRLIDGQWTKDKI